MSQLLPTGSRNVWLLGAFKKTNRSEILPRQIEFYTSEKEQSHVIFIVLPEICGCQVLLNNDRSASFSCYIPNLSECCSIKFLKVLERHGYMQYIFYLLYFWQFFYQLLNASNKLQIMRLSQSSLYRNGIESSQLEARISDLNLENTKPQIILQVLHCQIGQFQTCQNSILVIDESEANELVNIKL